MLSAGNGHEINMRLIIHLRFLLAGVAALLSFGLDAAGGSEQLHRFLTGITSLEARFEQSVLNEEHTQAIRSQGIFYLERPNKFRWDYSEPESQQIVADGRQVWLYDAELKQVSVQNQNSALQGTPALLLISGDPVENSFEVIDIGRRQDMDWVELIPRDAESQFVRVLLAFFNGDLLRMEMADKFGQVTRFQFLDIKHNPTFKSTFFQFVPPRDVDIYNR
ncbi:MAG: outer membrane lipoprotein chaperone LolA [Gammaproteobacteria bacterium]|nr:outer membrane lipoprotein chaperone LolA [Gammaproteobacteria bacterium]MCP5407003.1 outer membrane lipoprotein chaperone LolA [Chromatiaceae bacterium]